MLRLVQDAAVLWDQELASSWVPRKVLRKCRVTAVCSLVEGEGLDGVLAEQAGPGLQPRGDVGPQGPVLPLDGAHLQHAAELALVHLATESALVHVATVLALVHLATESALVHVATVLALVHLATVLALVHLATELALVHLATESALVHVATVLALVHLATESPWYHVRYQCLALVDLLQSQPCSSRVVLAWQRYVANRKFPLGCWRSEVRRRQASAECTGVGVCVLTSESHSLKLTTAEFFSTSSRVNLSLTLNVGAADTAPPDWEHAALQLLQLRPAHLQAPPPPSGAPWSDP
ncbi:hypothetical protein CRUP_020997 [Coryphaenoides rupestris]|nr:hypothetical protein CRUP_020997 [Coryphaenoides rupestris]